MLDPIKKLRIFNIVILLIVASNLLKWYPSWITFCILIPIQLIMFFRTLKINKKLYPKK
ncbi:MAG: hypothetical protein SLAVMIC_00550 [uncultured marine phage]|uniref:Uncharacterized protein n=1 Tax=uncultured marine phage TaxID=707152 RepID=A0A8D9CBR2_9VIRU|nr:MAG: hypothetical protein SLAVMIC_00550 [uncultured marine phage]